MYGGATITGVFLNFTCKHNTIRQSVFISYVRFPYNSNTPVTDLSDYPETETKTSPTQINTEQFFISIKCI